MDDFGPKASSTRVKMMANQLGLRSPKCLTKIAEDSEVVDYLFSNLAVFLKSES